MTVLVVAEVAAIAKTNFYYLLRDLGQNTEVQRRRPSLWAIDPKPTSARYPETSTRPERAQWRIMHHSIIVA